MQHVILFVTHCLRRFPRCRRCRHRPSRRHRCRRLRRHCQSSRPVAREEISLLT
jgi:hypothetical protein